MTITRTTKLFAATMAVSALGLGGFVIAQTADPQAPQAAPQAGQAGPKGRHHGFRGPGFGRGLGPGRGGPFAMLRGLDVTDAQREQIRGILDQNQEEMRAVHERLAAARKAEREAVEAVPGDEAQIRARATDVGAVAAEAAVLRSRVHAAVWGVLTPEQQEKAKALQAERQKRGAEMQQRWQDRRQQRQNRQQQRQTTPPAVEDGAGQL